MSACSGTSSHVDLLLVDALCSIRYVVSRWTRNRLPERTFRKSGGLVVLNSLDAPFSIFLLMAPHALIMQGFKLDRKMINPGGRVQQVLTKELPAQIS